MSIARANGERADISRTSQQLIDLVESEFLKEFPRGERYWQIYRLKEERDWSWRRIGRGVGLSATHCFRLFPVAVQMVAQVKKNFAEGVTFFRVVRDEDDLD